MAEIKSFPNNRSEYIGAQTVMRWLHGRTSGVFGAVDNCRVAAASGMSVEVYDGSGWLQNADGDGIYWWNDAEATGGEKLSFAIALNDTVYPRIDRVVVSWRTIDYTDLPTIEILRGDAVATTAEPPELTNNTNLRQISLAQVIVEPGAIAIEADKIIDERLDANVCGIVTESIEIDTSGIIARAEAILEELREAIAQAGSLQLIDNAVTTPKLNNKAVTTPKIADGAITKDITFSLPTSTSGQWVEEDGVYYYEKTYNGIAATSDIDVSPAPSDFFEWGSCQLFVSELQTDKIIFTCKIPPENALTAQIRIFKVEAET